MKKVSVTKFVERVMQGRCDDADAIAIIRIDEGMCQTAIIGIDELGTNMNAVKIAEAMKATLEGKLKIADSIGELLKKTGGLSLNDAREEMRSIDKNEFDSESNNDNDNDCLEMLASALGKAIFGGEFNADDD